MAPETVEAGTAATTAAPAAPSAPAAPAAGEVKPYRIHVRSTVLPIFN